MIRVARTVSRSGSPGPTPTPVSRPAAVAAHSGSPGQRVDGRRRHGRAAPAAADDQVRQPRLATSAALDSAAPTKPTGTPITAAAGVGARRGQDLQQPEQRGRGVADGHDRAVEVARATVRPRPPSGWCRAGRPAPGTRGSRSVQMTWLAAGSRDLVMPGRHHGRVAQHRARPRPARPAPAVPTPSDQARSAGRSVIPQAWIIRTATGSRSAGTALRSASARMIAKDRR